MIGFSHQKKKSESLLIIRDQKKCMECFSENRLNYSILKKIGGYKCHFSNFATVSMQTNMGWRLSDHSTRYTEFMVY